jgi:ABC-type bacteriocin/lantibiotic exporter with double-glycine peptidase domain
MITAVALLEAVGVASIFPFMMVVSNPEVLRQDGWLASVYTATGIGSENRFLMLLGAAVFIVLLVSNVLKALRAWLINSYTQLTAHVLSTRLVGAYLAQPYDYFLTRHSAELGKNVLAEVQQAVLGVIQPGMTVLAHCVVAVFLSALLLISDPILALSVVAALGGAYGLLYSATRLYLSRIGQERLKANREQYHVAAEAFSAVKEVKLRGLEAAYATRFARPSMRYARLQAANQTLAQVPRYGLEVIAFGGILLLVLYLLAVRQKLEDALPLIALYAFAGYRMLPIVQEIYASLAKIRYSQPALDLLHRDFTEKNAPVGRPAPRSPLPFSATIELNRVTYRYPSGDRPVLHDISVKIRKGTRVGFIGPTGSGKSTVVDLILGLLRPTAGDILIDGHALQSGETVRRWQCQIGYVPQHIFLADDTIIANIAFGQPAEAVNRGAVERAAVLAQLHEFIVGELPQGYDTPVGERGIRLSGGQRQRLGLARALYGDPAVLVFDEATSALDTDTEDAVMQAIYGLDREFTVIMIAHRLSTVRGCDVLFKLDTGRVVGSGSYEALLGRNAVATA